MLGWEPLGKLLIISGFLLVVLGGLLFLLPRVPLLGRLPGDIVIERENFRFYFPLVTSILLSAVLTVALWLFGRR